jgi:hypothetical protein
MNDSSRPGWIGSPERPASRAHSQLIERGGSQFWDELQHKLAAAVDSLYLHDLAGMITSFGGGIRVTLNRPGKAFNHDYTDVIFKRTPAEIRCTTLNDGTYTLRFCVTPDNKVAVTSTRRNQVMNAEQACEHIMTLLLNASGRQ